MKQRLISRRKIVSFLIMLSAIITICFITMNVEASSNNQYKTHNETTNEAVSPQSDLNSVFTFTPISDTECDVRLIDKTATKAIIPEKIELDGNEYNVTVIAGNGFTSASKLELVRLPKSVKTIGANAFANCKALTSLTLPGVEIIGANAFAMTKMEYLIIPTSVTSVASTILRGANTKVYVRSALEEGTTVPEGWVANWNGSNKNQNVEFNSDFIPEVKYEFVSSEVQTLALGDDVDLRNGGYYVTGYQEFCTIDTDDYKEVYIPATHTGTDGVEYPIIGIDSYAFYFNDIDKVTIGYSSTPINLATESFYGLNGTLITFNREVKLLSEDFDGNEVISESVFACSTVKTIILPDSLIAIGNNMFDGCENLRDIHFIAPDGTLSSLAEVNIAIRLNSTQKVYIPSSVTYIGNSAFALTRKILELYIPNSVEEAGSNIINGWTSNQTVYVNFTADDPALENWNQYWALGSGTANTARVVYNLSNTEYNITYNIDSKYHNNPNKYVSSQGLTLSPATMSGYSFDGWYLDENFVTSIESIAIGTTGNLNLYAKMTPNTYMIKYEKNKPGIASNPVLGDMNDSSHSYGVSSSISANAYSLKGWTFTGWNTKADGTGDYYNEDSTVTNFAESGTKSLFAQWTQKTYTLAYNGNRPNNASSSLQGSMNIESNHKYEDEFTLQELGYTVYGWRFVNWNTKADGTGTTYLAEATVSSLSETEMTLYAQWSPNSYTIKYNKNNPNTTFIVKGSMDISTHTFDIPSFLRINDYTLEGYTFIGWNTQADGNGTSYSNGAEVKTAKDSGQLELYAKWQANTYTIIYNSNRPDDASEAVSGNTVVSSHQVDKYDNLSPNGFNLIGWTFTGWNTLASGAGTTYNNQDSVKNLTTTNSSVTLYAQWDANAYTVVYNANGGTGVMVSSYQEYDSQYNLRANTFAKIGYRFIGWRTNQNNTGTLYRDEDEVSNLTSVNNGIVTLYAQWEVITYTVIYNSNKPSKASSNVVGTMTTSTFTYDTSSNLKTNGYTLTGWAFKGWNTKTDGSGTTYTGGQLVKNLTSNNSITLYAQWIANTYTVIYNSNKPNNASSNVAGTMEYSKFTYDNSSNLRTKDYTLTGWEFIGWKDEIGTTYTDGQLVKNLTLNDSITLYAQWKAKTYNVIYHPNYPECHSGLTNSLSSTTVTYDTSCRLNEAYTLVSWEMKYWTMYETDTGSKYYPADLVNKLLPLGNESVINLYAQWEEKELQDSVNGIYHEIATVNQFNSLRDLAVDSSYRFRLMRDINLLDWEPIFEFNCLLDLNGHTINYSNIYVEQGNNFGFVITNEGTIRNGYFTPRIRIHGGSKQTEYYNYIGGVAADNYGLIEYISVNSFFGINENSMNNNNNNVLDIDATSPYYIVGGIVGSNAGTIRYCDNYASIGGYDYIGGITGIDNSELASVYRCINGGNLWYRSIIKGYKFVGGISGMCQDSYTTFNENFGKITFAYSDVTDPKDYVYMANIVGWAGTRAVINNNECYGTIVISNNVAERNDIQAYIIKTNGEPIGAQSDEYFIKDTSGGDNCISLGTLITLADGSLVPVESLTGSESLLVWNMLTGQFDEAPILFIDKDDEELYNVINLNFSDGSIVKVIGEHGFWDITLNQYVYLKDDAEKYVGHYFAKEEVDEEGNINLLTVELISVEIAEELTIPFSPVTFAHLCYFVDGMLSMPGGIEGLFNIFEVDSETMTYDQVAMEKDIELYGLYSYEEFSQLVDVPKEMFEAVNGKYLKVAIGKGLITIERLQDLVDRYILFFE